MAEIQKPEPIDSPLIILYWSDGTSTFKPITINGNIGTFILDDGRQQDLVDLDFEFDEPLFLNGRQLTSFTVLSRPINRVFYATDIPTSEDF
jgi:hypothetical protein